MKIAGFPIIQTELNGGFGGDRKTRKTKKTRKTHKSRKSGCGCGW